MRILVIGKGGQVGGELSRQSRPDWELTAVGRNECDLCDQQSLRDLIRRLAPEVVLNAAAYTAVDQAERERELCFAINAAAPSVLAEEAARLDALLIHYSTDYVFDGEKPDPYLEDDEIHPLNVYGASKAAGESAVMSAARRYLVLRTTWVYDGYGKNFLRTMLRLGAERPELRVVDDQIGSPTSAAAIAAATARLIEGTAKRPCLMPSGIYHMTACGATSWCGFARAIIAGSTLPAKPQVIPISSADYPTPAKRPKNSLLSNEKFERTFGFRLSLWTEQLEEVLAKMPAMDAGSLREPISRN